MWLVFGRKKKIKPLEGGRRERRTCPECGANTTFIEVSVEKTYTAYVVVDLFDSESTAFQCKECGEVMDLERTQEPELSAREKAKLAKAQAKAEAQRKKELEAAAKKARAEAVAKEEALDDELAAMKARLGID
jgi:predicted RNA-binding Zn-ribbon protein involved in translation (DUF1610 family)